MGIVALESLELTPKELAHCKSSIRQMAYDNWLSAGQPTGDGREFLVRAERDWIEHRYVPTVLVTAMPERRIINTGGRGHTPFDF